MVITLFDTVGVSGLQEWVNSYGLSHPVLLDPAFQVSRDYNPDNAIPSMTILTPGLVIAERDLPTVTEEKLLSYLD